MTLLCKTATLTRVRMEGHARMKLANTNVCVLPASPDRIVTYQQIGVVTVHVSMEEVVTSCKVETSSVSVKRDLLVSCLTYTVVLVAHYADGD